MPTDLSGAPVVERLVRHDRAILVTGLILLCGLSWLWLLRGAGMDMSAFEMTRLGLFPHLTETTMAMAPMPMEPSIAEWLSELGMMTAMWWVMMVAMMLPSAAPMILLYAGTLRHAGRQGRMTAATPATTSFLAGYLLVWLGFSLAAALLQIGLVTLGSLSSMMLWSRSPWLSAGILAVAGVYQLTPVKRACLEHCRSPAHWLSRHWKPGARGAFRMGVAHGIYCLGCCWSLMLLLFVGGVMNLIWIAALAIFVFLEKLSLPGLRGGHLSAALLGLWALATMLVSG